MPYATLQQMHFETADTNTRKMPVHSILLRIQQQQQQKVRENAKIESEQIKRRKKCIISMTMTS